MAFRLLLVDDHQLFSDLTKKFLEDNGYVVDIATSGERAIQLVREHGNEYALVILDYTMTGLTGPETAQKILKSHPNLYILIYSSDVSRDALKDSWKSGAVEFVDKSAEHHEFLAAVSRWCQKFKEIHLTVPAVSESENLKAISKIGLVGVSSSMSEVAELVMKYRDKPSTVLVLGESGTGKEKIAQALHGNTQKAFRAVNCAAYAGNSELMESELFGVEKGSFTGAIKDKKGVFEEVGQGTLFLDEVHALSPIAQQKLLRALQEKKVRPVGSTREYPVHFRLIAAAKPNLEALVKSGHFLLDLYHRLNVLRIEVPALRDRIEDIAPLVAHFCQLNSSEGSAPKQVFVRTLRYFERYSWPGNVRELENTIESLCATVEADRIRPEDLDAKFFEEAKPVRESAVAREIKGITRDEIVAALGNSRSMREAARKLGIPHSTFHVIVKRFGIETQKGRKANG